MKYGEMITKAMDDIIALKLKALDMWIEEVVDAIGDIGTPEKLLKKPYESWTEEDMIILQQVYGDELQKIIADREYKAVKKLEQAVQNGTTTNT